MNRCIFFFIIFPVTETNGKKKIIRKKIFFFFCIAERIWATAQLYCEKKIIFFLLQGWYCIAIEVGWLLGGMKIVLQYNYCIAGKRRLGWNILYFNTIFCIVTAGARGTGVGHATWACCWAVGCALGALSLFLTRFDSVLYLSQFLDIVRELSS